MQPEILFRLCWRRRFALLIIATFGLLTIVGSGGGVGGAPPDLTFDPVPSTSIFPSRVTAQAGTSVTFTASTANLDLPQYQWQRSVDGGVTFADIPGATVAAYALSPVQLADDGAVFRANTFASGGGAVLAVSNKATLLVSSMPAIVFSDGEFDPADWTADATAEPALNGPTHSEDRRADGGFPGAYRHMVHTMTAGPSDLRVFNSKSSATYDPQALGAIYVIDYGADCNALNDLAVRAGLGDYAMFEQAGRRYVSREGRGCFAGWSAPFGPVSGRRASDFVQVDGPACGSGEACPNFTATGAPLRFGFARRVPFQAGVPAGVVEHGIDNWRMSVWRH